MGLTGQIANGKRVVGMMAAVVLGTSISTSNACATQVTPPAQTQAIDEISRYCQACWRNARLPADRWPDCTQQVFTRILQSIEMNKWSGLLKSEGEEKTELVRAIDAVKKRTQRDRRFGELPNDVGDQRNTNDCNILERREELNRVAGVVLNERQQKIVELSANGWPVPEIALELGTTPERISDEKYKAIRKLRVHFHTHEM